MGHSQNQRASANQPEKGALDTNQDKSLNETKTTDETEEAMEPNEDDEEEQPIAEQGTAEEAIEEATPKEEEKAEAKKEEAVAAEEAEKEAEAVTPEEAEEVKKKEKREKAPEEEEIVEERIYTIPLRRAWISPRKKRAPRAVRIVKSFIQRHMKIEAEAKADEEEEEKGRLVISNEVNEKLWSRGIEKPPRNIRVRAVKDKEGTVTLYLAEGD